MGEPTPSTEHVHQGPKHVHEWSPAYWAGGVYGDSGSPAGPGMYVMCLDRDCNLTRPAQRGPAIPGMLTK